MKGGESILAKDFVQNSSYAALIGASCLLKAG